LQEGTDQRYGARHLKRAIERNVVYPLANLLATDQVTMGDLVCIDWNEAQKQLSFVREEEGAIIPTPILLAREAAAAAEVGDGRSANPPAEGVQEARKSRAAQPLGGPHTSGQSTRKPER